MIIRPYQPHDLEPVTRVFTEAVHRLAANAYDDEQRDAWAPRPPDLEAWQVRLDELTTLVAEIDGQLAGFIAWEATGRIDLLFTAPGFERQGVASSLYQQAERAIERLGHSEIVTEASLVARPFFERQGFQAVEEQTVARRGVLFSRVLMKKQLSSDETEHERHRRDSGLEDGT